MSSSDIISEPSTDPHANGSPNPRSVKFIKSQIDDLTSNVLNQNTEEENSNENESTNENENSDKNSQEINKTTKNSQNNDEEEEEEENEQTTQEQNDEHVDINSENIQQSNESNQGNQQEKNDDNVDSNPENIQQSNQSNQQKKNDEHADSNPNDIQKSNENNQKQNSMHSEKESIQEFTSLQGEKQSLSSNEDIQNGPDPNDLDYWTKEALAMHSLDGCNPRLLNRLCNQVREERDHLVSMGLYDDSVKANEALSNAQEYKDSVYKRIVQKKKQEELADRLEDAKNYFKNLQEMAKRQEPNIISSFEEEMANLIQRQNEELEKLTETWESNKKKRLYNRSSPGLRNLRTQSILLLNSHRFDEMEQVQKKADELRLQESYNNQRQLETDFQEKLAKTLDRHEIERNNLKIAQGVQRDKYEAAKNHDFKIAQMRIQKLERELVESNDVEKIWVHYTHGEMRGPPGPRPSPRSGRKNCLQTVQVSDFNTLNLPPLLDNPKWRMAMPKDKKQKEERAKELIALARSGNAASSRISQTMHGGAMTMSPRSPRKTGVRTSYPKSSQVTGKRKY